MSKKLDKNKIAFLYPRISHYREDFFEYFINNYNCDIYIYENNKSSNNDYFKICNIKTKILKSLLILSKFRIFNFIPLLNSKYKVIILIGEMKVLPIWFLLLFSKLAKKKVILWGHGISTFKYLEEEKKLNPIRILFHKLADYIWLYTENEKKIWAKYIDESIITALNNTLNTREILNQKTLNKVLLKEKYEIKTSINFIYCARFSSESRRIDLLITIIQKLDKEKFGFIIIGDGKYKPDFSKYKNVFDFGTVYNKNKKNELFQVADIYLHPAWIGLSCNEALAYSKPILTFKRSIDIHHGVEYSYLDASNSYIADDMEDMLYFINNLNRKKIIEYQINSREYAKTNLGIDKMINNAKGSLNLIFKEKI